MELSEEIIVLTNIIRHIGLVQSHLYRMAHALEVRASVHDLSKFSEDEFSGLADINRIARTYPYGSKEYMDSLKGNKALDLHFSRNRHHPEHHPEGVANMTLFDFIEMVVDWKAANIIHGGEPSWETALQIHFDRFKMTPEQIYLVRMIANMIS